MKVVRVIARLNVGGPARHVVWLSEALARLGHQSVLVAGVVPPGEDDMTYFARAHGVAPVVIPEMSREISPKDFVTVWKLYKLFRRERPDVIHTHTAKAGTVGRVAALLYRWLTPAALAGRPRPVRTVHTYHGHIFHSYYGPLKTRAFLLIERLLARAATDRLVVISAQQKREIHEQFRVGRGGQVRVVPLGIDADVYRDWPRRRDALRGELNVGPDEVLVGIVGRLTEVKNHKLFLRSIAGFLQAPPLHEAAAPRVRFVVIGDGHLRGDLEAQAASLGVAGDVVFLGARQDPERFYPGLDAVALTSLNEGTPLTLIEAMANARAVVATAVGGVVDLLGDAEQGGGGGGDSGAPGYVVCERGLRVAAGDAASFARALRRLCEDRALRERLGKRGEAFVRARHSKERLVADVLALYGEMLGTTAVADPGRRAAEVERREYVTSE